jgi:hypothetical protein
MSFTFESSETFLRELESYLEKGPGHDDARLKSLVLHFSDVQDVSSMEKAIQLLGTAVGQERRL